jgi:hypothetical protein
MFMCPFVLLKLLTHFQETLYEHHITGPILHLQIFKFSINNINITPANFRGGTDM